jgi:hypothetical protein
VQLLLDQAPPQLSVNVPWRELYVGGAFGQRELADDSDMRRAGRSAALTLGWAKTASSAWISPGRPSPARPEIASIRYEAIQSPACSARPPDMT